MNRLHLTLVKKEKVVRNAWAFTFERPKHFDFLAGQYIRIFDPVVGEAVFRDFTIASSPLKKDTLLIIIKEGISNYKRHLFGINEEERLLVDAPLGRFVLNDEEKSPLVTIAGGVGITPFYSMIQYLTEKKLKIPLTFIASYSKVEDILFLKDLMEIEENASTIQIVHTITQSEQIGEYKNLHEGRISEQLIKKYVHDISIPTFLISGSPSFVIDMENLLTNMGINSRQIRMEVFLGFN